MSGGECKWVDENYKHTKEIEGGREEERRRVREGMDK